MTFALARNVTATETEDGTVLLDQRSGRYWQLNGTASTVLHALLAGRPAEDAAALLRERHPRGSERAAEDVAELVTALRDAKLVTS